MCRLIRDRNVVMFMLITLLLTPCAIWAAADCVVPASGVPFRVSPQPGWTMYCHKTQDQANSPVAFNLESEPAAEWTAYMDVTFCSRAESGCRTADERMKSEATLRTGKSMPGLTDMGTFRTHDGLSARVVKWGIDSKWWQGKAYVQSKSDVITITLTCRSAAAFDKSYSSFASLVASLTFPTRRPGARIDEPPNHGVHPTACAVGAQPTATGVFGARRG
jgi:hypothetical protein